MKSRRRQLQSSPRGFSLVLVLCLTAIVTTILLAFLAVMRIDFKTSENYSQGLSSDQVARGAMVYLAEQLKDEIAANSKTYNSNGSEGAATPPFIYLPQKESNMVVQAAGITKAATAIISDHPPLVKISKSGNKMFTGSTNGNPDAAKDGPDIAVDAPSGTASTNGRRLTASRWNKPKFFQDWPTAIPTPDWINVTRKGPENVLLSEASDQSISNSKYVVGRFAYAIYDISGLLDITQAGYPTSGSDLSADFIAKKGNLALADLTQIPNPSTANPTAMLTAAQITDLCTWRNKASLASLQTNYLSNFIPANGGTAVFTGDDTFVNRQDLIRYAEEKNLSGSLAYLTSFHRNLNAPSFAPSVNASGAAYKYKDIAPTTTSINPAFPNVRVKAPFTRNNGNPAVVGEPLVQQRFALSRIKLLSEATPDMAKIMAHFGLSKSSGSSRYATWTYNHGSANAIKTLDQVATANREPDFFELLKAAILSGSLGRDAGVFSTTSGGIKAGPFSKVPRDVTLSTDAQILQIGANIIDQYDSDSYPTTIYCNLAIPLTEPDPILTYEKTFYGVEDLPYMLRIGPIAYDVTPPKYDGSNSTIKMFLRPVLWNPHQQPAVLPTDRPTELRLQAFGRATFVLNYTYVGTGGTRASVPGPPTDFDTDGTADTGTLAGRIEFPNDDSFRSNPTPLTRGMVNADPTKTPPENLPGIADPTNWPSDPAVIALRSMTWHPDLETIKNPVTLAYRTTICEWTSTNFSIALQWKDPNGTWRTYSILNRINRTINRQIRFTTDPSGPTPFGNESVGDTFQVYDPRTGRFGVSVPSTTAPAAYPLTQSLRPSNANGQGFLLGWPATTSGFSYLPAEQNSLLANPFYPGTLSQNISSSQMKYNDIDGTLRFADGAFATGTTPDGYPLSPGNVAGSQRPLILNRPFRSVGELGYVFRDLPFKSLDLFTSNSADGGLLDIFSLEDAPETSGKVNLNSAPLPVLKALLSKGLKREADVTALIGSETPTSDLANIAQYVQEQVIANPMTNRGDLVNRLGDGLGSKLSQPQDKANKTHREATVRTLAEVTDTRTWNLLIDVIAQTGRYPSSAKDFNGFIANAERRYWLHVAIDRFTGEIISRRLEPVYE